LPTAEGGGADPYAQQLVHLVLLQSSGYAKAEKAILREQKPA